MQFRQLLFLLLPATIAVAPAVAAPATTVVCPASASVAISADQSSTGWSASPASIATFKKAEVVNAVGLTGPTLSCAYSAGAQPAPEVGRLTRPEPPGLLCSVNATKASQFDCFARPGAAAH